jgi:hypothetical protein
MTMRTKGVKMDFENLIARGENPRGLTAQTANGTAHWKGTGWNKDEPNWGDGFPAAVGAATAAQAEWNSPDRQVRPGPTRPDGRSNRTGE